MKYYNETHTNIQRFKWELPNKSSHEIRRFLICIFFTPTYFVEYLADFQL